ncbi:MAG: hypothetical protein HFG70_08240 [Hungatella sp.]|nr:hypothetical protein [Hungatella sp.]
MMGRRLLDVDFEHIEEGQVKSLKGNYGKIHGSIPVVKGYDGRKALYFANKAGEPAAQYIDFGKFPFGKESFTVNLWIKTHRDGCNGWPHPDELLKGADFKEGKGRNGWQKRYGGVLLANTGYSDLFDKGETGFSLANLQPSVYFNTCVQGSESTAPVRLWGMKEPDDDRWHLLSVVFDRKGKLQVYVDDTLLKETDIRFMEGESLDWGHLMLGADGHGLMGLGEMAVSSLSIREGVMGPWEISCLFAAGDIKRIREELKGRVLPGDIYKPEAAAHMVSKAGAAVEKVLEMEEAWRSLDGDSDPGEDVWRDRYQSVRSLQEDLEESYESFLLDTKKPDAAFLLLSDAHVEGQDSPRAMAYRKALLWGRELGMDAFADCGDYSNYGKAAELDGYWNMVRDSRGTMAALVALGNHETLEKSCSELVAYHTGRLAENGMVPEGYGELYFEYAIGDCHFLVLSQYSDTYEVTGYNIMWAHAADLKKKQMTWLEDRLKAYSGKGHPVMLFIHNAVREVLARQTDGNYRERAVILSTWADKFYKLLEQYPDVVICTGHVHHGFGDSCGAWGTRFGYHVIDVPSFCKNNKGYGMSEESGPVTVHTGYAVYLFGTRILVRALEFENRRWLTSYDQIIEIPC